MVKKFQIAIFQSPQQAFHPGSELRGTLTVEVGEPKGFHYIIVSLIGRAQTSFLIHDHDDHTHDDSYCHEEVHEIRATREYVNLRVVVWNTEQACGGELQSGCHTFPFQFTIPNQRLPSSFRGRNSIGNIRYFVEGRIGTGLLRFDHVVEAEFPLLEVVNINLPLMQRPIRTEVQKTICCWFCASGPITLTAESPRRGYCIGEAIPLTVIVENASTKQIKASVKLQQLVTYRAQADVRYDRTSVLQLVSGPMREKHNVWCPENELIVPLQTVPTVTSCDIITVDYVLVVEAVIPSARNASIKIPVTIGNTPFREVSSLDPTPEVPLTISSQPQPTALAYIPQPQPPTSYPLPPSELIPGIPLLSGLTSYPLQPSGLTSNLPHLSGLTSNPLPSYGVALQYQY